MKSVRPTPPVYEMISQKIFDLTNDGFPYFFIRYNFKSYFSRFKFEVNLTKRTRVLWSPFLFRFGFKKGELPEQRQSQSIEFFELFHFTFSGTISINIGALENMKWVIFSFPHISCMWIISNTPEHSSEYTRGLISLYITVSVLKIIGQLYCLGVDS